MPKVILLNSYRVESFWQTPFLEPEAIREQLILGLEQARDSVLPEVIIEKRFKPFVEDRLPHMAAGTLGLVGHPVTCLPARARLPSLSRWLSAPKAAGSLMKSTCCDNPACSLCNLASAFCASKPL